VAAAVAVAAAVWRWRQHGGVSGGCGSTAAAAAVAAACWWWRQLGGSAVALAAEARWQWRWQQSGGSVAAAVAAAWRQQHGGGGGTSGGSVVVVAAAWGQRRRQHSGGGGTAKWTTRACRHPRPCCDGSPSSYVGQLRGDEDDKEDKCWAMAAGQQQRGYNNRGDNGPPLSHANGEDNDTAAGNNQGDATAVDVDGGDVDAGTLSIILAASNTPNHDNNAKNDDANAKDATGRKTLMRDATAVGTGGGALALVVILPLRNNDIGHWQRPVR
jgi:hypothetical protein